MDATTAPAIGTLFIHEGRQYRVVAVRTSPSTGVEVVWFCRAVDPRRSPDAWMTLTKWSALNA